MDSGTKIISLIGENFTVNVKEDNPIFKLLSSVIGETVLVYQSKPVIRLPYSPEPEIKQPEYVMISAEHVFSDFYDSFKEWESMEDKPVVYQVLKNHLKMILGKEEGLCRLEKIAEKTFKQNDLYLVTV